MKRITMILLATLSLAWLVYAQSQNSFKLVESALTTQTISKGAMTSAAREDYVKLVKARASESAIKDWARKNKLVIASLKSYDIIVVPEQSPVTDAVAAAAYDATKCPTADGLYPIKNTLGQTIGAQNLLCKASSCSWVKDEQGRWNRICGGWKCENTGKIMS
jgi:hypothetical protein